MEDRTPFFARYDTNGRAIRGQFSPEFVNWCAAHAEDPKTVAALQWSEYPEDVLFLAKAEDQRARELFRKGLESPNPLVLGYAIQGLGRLRDVDAIPIIAARCQQLPEDSKIGMAMQLPWFARPEADAVIAGLVTDPKLREGLASQVQRARLDELERARRRAGLAHK